MKASIIKIGNSKGIRIPKPLLEESELGSKVELTVVGKKIIITKAGVKPYVNPEALLSQKAFSDWLRPEEDEAWTYLQ
ncbi:MAG: AbrB/MazE/SpoVT family DNA-binding domain-containing protein [Candidatus Saccharimonadales bacterium]